MTEDIPAVQALYEIRDFADDKGIKIQSRTAVDQHGVAVSSPKFFAGGTLSFNLNGSGPGSFNFMFDVDGDTIGEAFANFAECYKTASKVAEDSLRKQLQEQNRPRLLVPQNGHPKTRFK